jgi:hypothetical protein
MQEIAGAKPLNFHMALPQPPVRPPVTVVTAGADAGSAGTAADGRASGDSRHPGPAALPPDPRASRPDRFTLTGPSPAFQASILEVERDFRNVLARIEATRAKAEVDVVFGTQASTPDDENPGPAAASADPAQRTGPPSDTGPAEAPDQARAVAARRTTEVAAA